MYGLFIRYKNKDYNLLRLYLYLFSFYNFILQNIWLLIYINKRNTDINY